MKSAGFIPPNVFCMSTRSHRSVDLCPAVWNTIQNVNCYILWLFLCGVIPPSTLSGRNMASGMTRRKSHKCVVLQLKHVNRKHLHTKRRLSHCLCVCVWMYPRHGYSFKDTTVWSSPNDSNCHRLGVSVKKKIQFTQTGSRIIKKTLKKQIPS